MAPVGYRARMTQYPGQYGPPQQQPVQVVVQAPKYAVTKQRKDTSHTFHLIMTIITGGAWGIFVWLPITIWHSMGPKQKVKTRYR